MSRPLPPRRRASTNPRGGRRRRSDRPGRPGRRTRRRWTGCSPRRRAALGRIDVCVAVHGIWPREDVPIWELPLERWESTLPRTSPPRSSSPACIPAERSSGPGTGRSSSSARLPGSSARRGMPDYAAAKCAILGGLLPLAEERDRARRAARARECGRTRLNRVSDDSRPRRSQRVRAVSRTMALRKVAQPRGHRRARSSCSPPTPSRPCVRPGRHGRRWHGRPNRPRRVRGPG